MFNGQGPQHHLGPNSSILRHRFGISRATRTLHGALLDSELLADVYIELTGGRQVGMSLEVAAEEDSAQENQSDDAGLW